MGESIRMVPYILRYVFLSARDAVNLIAVA